MKERLKGASVLVTGGCGFIGGHLVEALVRAEANVSIFDRCNAYVGAGVGKVKLIVGDLSDEHAVRQAVQGKQFVFHLGANPSVPYSILYPVDTHMTNTLGTMYVALACAASEAKLVFSSSCSVYGKGDGDPASEGGWKQPLSPYALQKLTGEGYIRIFGDEQKLDGTSLRYFNVYGPGQSVTSSYSGVVAKFCQAALRGESVTIYGDGQQTRDFIYVDDVVQANLLAATNPDAKGKIFNVGTGNQTRLLELLNIVREITGKDIPAVYKEPRPGDVRNSWANVAFIKVRLGFKAHYDLTTGLTKTIKSMR